MSNAAAQVHSVVIPMWTIMTEMEALEGEYSDAFKAAYGVRPRGISHGCNTVAELEKVISSLYAIAQEECEWEQAQAKKLAEEFEQHIQKAIDMGAGDRLTALRWMIQNEIEEDGWFDVEQWIFNLGVLFIDYGTELKKEIEGMLPEIIKKE